MAKGKEVLFQIHKAIDAIRDFKLKADDNPWLATVLEKAERELFEQLFNESAPNPRANKHKPSKP